MSIQDFFGSTTSLIAALGTLVAAISAFWQAVVSFQSQKKKTSQESQQQISQSSDFVTLLKMPAFDLGILLALVSIGIFIARIIVPSPPFVTITSPALGQQIEVSLAETGSGSFTISGISTDVFTSRTLRVYVLIHPADPFAAGWWIQQPATVDRNGQWTILAWIGNTDFPPHVGDKIDILVVATEPEQVVGREKVSDPKDLNPLAQSDIIKVSIGTIK